MIMGDYRRTSSVTTMLNDLNWLSLDERRYLAVCMMYKIRNNLVEKTKKLPNWAIYNHQRDSSRFSISHTNLQRMPAHTSQEPSGTAGNNLTFDPARWSSCMPLPGGGGAQLWVTRHVSPKRPHFFFARFHRKTPIFTNFHPMTPYF